MQSKQNMVAVTHEYFVFPKNAGDQDECCTLDESIKKLWFEEA
jgi:hypothetical protein